MTALALLLVLSTAGPTAADPTPQAAVGDLRAQQAGLEALWRDACLWEVGANLVRVPRARAALAARGERTVAFLVPDKLDTGDTLVTRALAAVLTEIGAGVSVPPLLAALGSERALVRRNAAELLGTLGAREAIPGIVALLDDPDGRLGGLAALGKLGAREAVPRIAAVMAGEAPERVRVTAAVTLGEIGGEAAISALAGMLRSASVPLRFSAQFALQKLAAVAALREALDAPELRVRLHAIAALGHLADPGTRADLVPLLEDPDRRVRGYAVEALGALLDRATRRRLERLRSVETDPFVRGKLKQALAEPARSAGPTGGTH